MSDDELMALAVSSDYTPVGWKRNADLCAFAHLVEAAAYELASGACLAERVSGETGTEGDDAYNIACEHCAAAVGALGASHE